MRRHFKIKTLMITALFWVITQRAVVISYRRFGTTYRSFFGFLILENGTDGLSGNGSVYLHALRTSTTHARGSFLRIGRLTHMYNIP